MNKLKIFVFGLGVLFFESIILAILVPFLLWLLSVPSNFEGIKSFAIFVLVFMMYKTAFELWLFCLVVVIKVRKQKLELSILHLGKLVSGSFMLVLLIFLAVDSKAVLDIFTVYAVAFAPSIIIAYFMFKRFWENGVIWISKKKIFKSLSEVSK